MKRAIINADDFGLSRGVNEGIILAHRKGILTSATVMANMAAFDSAVEMSRGNEKLGLGVHLNLLRGRPLSAPDKVATLLRNDGSFLASPYRLLRGLISKKIKLEEAEREFRAQIEKALAAGIAVTHLDSEKHVHTLPPIFRIVLKLAREYGISRVRFIREWCFSSSLSQTAKAYWLGLSCALMKKKIRESGIIVTDRFVGVCRSGRMTASYLKKVLAGLREGVTEVMTHPGFVTGDTAGPDQEMGPSYIHPFRERELEALLDDGVKQVVREKGIELIHFGEM